MAFDPLFLINVGFYISFAIVFALLAIGFNLQWGYTGLFNAGIAGFFLIGAYTAAIIALPTLRLRADYLAIATLAFAEVVRTIAINLEPITAGTIGIVGIPRLLEFSGPNKPYLTTATVVGVGAAIILVLLVALYFIVESPWGW